MAAVTTPRTTSRSDRAALLEFAVLREFGQLAQAERELCDRGLIDPSPVASPGRKLARRVLRRPAPPPNYKTWDVRRAIDAFVACVEPSEPVLDVGCFNCDMLPALKRLGYGDLAGIDFNPAVDEMPFADAIDYRVGDLLDTPWPDGHFAGLSAISVIEHGVADVQLCREVARLLRPGGIFVFTTDFWPSKVVTAQRFFDLDWRIFDTAEIDELISVAARHGLRPVSDPGDAIRDAGTPAIEFEGERYTFLYGAFVRD
jgi:SAM-dependent methyltransferase